MAANDLATRVAAACATFCLLLATTDVSAQAQTAPNGKFTVYHCGQACIHPEADTPEVRAMVRRGLSYLSGIGVTRSEEQAAALFRRAADAGNADAMNHLGLMLLSGRGVAANYDEARSWFCSKSAGLSEQFPRASARGNALCAYMYLHNDKDSSIPNEKDREANRVVGYGVALNRSQQAARMGDELGALDAGLILDDGLVQGIGRNAEQAKAYYAQAARTGDPGIARIATERMKRLQEDDRKSSAVVSGAIALLGLVLLESGETQPQATASSNTRDPYADPYAAARARHEQQLADCAGQAIWAANTTSYYSSCMGWIH